MYIIGVQRSLTRSDESPPVNLARLMRGQCFFQLGQDVFVRKALARPGRKRDGVTQLTVSRRSSSSQVLSGMVSISRD